MFHYYFISRWLGRRENEEIDVGPTLGRTDDWRRIKNIFGIKLISKISGREEHALVSSQTTVHIFHISFR